MHAGKWTRFSVTLSLFSILITNCAVAPQSTPTSTATPAIPADDPSPPSASSTLSVVVELENYLEELAREDKYSGVVLIAKDGLPILERAYGIADRNYDIPNQLDTKFNLASMNKMFTAVAILQLVEQGRISLEDRIIDLFPDYPNPEAVKIITVHHLLTHTSGLGDIMGQEYRDRSPDYYKTHRDYLEVFADKLLLFDPGSRAAYSNAGYLVLGIIIEEVTGSTYYEYIDENIYQRCGMMESGSYEADRVLPNKAIGYAGNIRSYGEVSSNIYLIPFRGISAGGGYSTAGDMNKFSNCLVNHQLLSPEFTELLLEGKDSKPIPGMEGEYAYGFVDDLVNSQRIVGHGGAMPGVCTSLDIYLDSGYTVVLLSNSSHDCIKVILKTRQTLTAQ